MVRRALIIHPTAMAEWHTLLFEAQERCRVHLDEAMESYLVFLLMHFTQAPHVINSVLGLEFLQSLRPGAQQQLKEVGDKCLLFSGLFPGKAAQRRVKLSYFIRLGQTAYALFSQQEPAQEALYGQLCQEFPRLIDVLLSLRQHSDFALDLLQAVEGWQETQSDAALQQFQDITPSLPCNKRRQSLN